MIDIRKLNKYKFKQLGRNKTATAGSITETTQFNAKQCKAICGIGIGKQQAQPVQAAMRKPKAGEIDTEARKTRDASVK